MPSADGLRLELTVDTKEFDLAIARLKAELEQSTQPKRGLLAAALGALAVSRANRPISRRSLLGFWKRK
jgi:hypothetical protein